MVVTVYETQTPDGWDGSSLLTTLERATITQVVQQTPTATDGASVTTLSTAPTAIMASTRLSSVTTPVPTSAEPSSFSTSSSTSLSTQSTSAGNPPKAAQMSTGSIVGMAVGSVASLILLVTFLLFAFGFRLRRARRRSDDGIIEQKKSQQAAAGAPGSHNGKAELEDAAYTRRLERLHDGAKPELEGSRPRKAGWRAFSLRSLKRGLRPGVAELDAGTVTQGPHELPA
ncbi:hypothetical protein INS49_010583 [Diaporthe citri]|uniref:uncharacterized protein n=1 Tax=Diaporthe citri TaxID=83186 RepID=UPI001C812E4C|nr:uncharacterized protein INS49_010583 [Diaporthe citri]KAG6362353.1 hypothetical protein INS49_010583 [Diaporthe citri]